MRGEAFAPETLDISEKRQLVRRIAESNSFRRAPRQREFLLYVADCTIANRLEGVREQAIAENVFHRDSGSYDLQDSIVRAEARNLRRRLDLYFETEGKHEPLAVSMPKGGYSLSFERRSVPIEREPAPAPVSATKVGPAPLPSSLPALSAEPRLARSLRFYKFICALLFASALAAFFLALHWRTVPASPVARPPALPFSALFDSALDTYIVTSDSSVLEMLLLSGQRIAVNDYIVRSYPEMPDKSRAIFQDMFNRFNNTNADEMSIAALIMRSNASVLSRTFLRSGHQLQLSDFKGHNVILIGSPISNPWAQLYTDRLNFQFDFNSERAITFHNKAPRRGELPDYPAPGDDQHHWSYAHLVFLPGISEPGSVLLIAGTTLGATTAAGEFLLDRSRLERELKLAGIDPSGAPRYFELLLRATTFTGGATQSEVIARRAGK